ncbi:MAG: hypothetical protein PUD64_01300 [Bacteroidales bacterium]|nr:hypothetical protein [Bacteroidales bacterium]
MPGAPRYTYIIATPEAVAGCPATDDSCGVDNENWTCGVRRLRRQVDSMCVCSDGGAVVERSEISEHSEWLADACL